MSVGDKLLHSANIPQDNTSDSGEIDNRPWRNNDNERRKQM